MSVLEPDHIFEEAPQLIASVASKPKKVKILIRFECSIHQAQFESIDYSKNLEFTSSIKEEKPSTSLGITAARDETILAPQKINLEIAEVEKEPKDSIFPAKTKRKKTENSPKTKKDNEKDPEKVKLSEPPNTSTIQLYMIWPGKNRFFFNGRAMLGPKGDQMSYLLSWSLIIVISFIYFLVAFSFVWKKVSVILSLMCIYLLVSVIVFFLLTSFTDPGIIPRKCVWEVKGAVPWPYNGQMKEEIQKEENNEEDNENEVAIEVENNEVIKRNIIDEKMDPNLLSETVLKYCETCHIYRPPRASHCRY